MSGPVSEYPTTEQHREVIEAGTAASEAVHRAADVAQRVIGEITRALYSQASLVRIEVVLTPSYTDHLLEVYDADDQRIDTGDWPMDETDDDFWIDAMERAVGYGEECSIRLEPEVQR